MRLVRTPRDPDTPEKAFTVEEVAKAFDCSHMTVRRWITAGHLKATDLRGPTGRKPKLRIRESELTRFLDERAVA